MRYGPLVGRLKNGIDGSYRFVMLALMIVEISLLSWLVYLEATHR